eukprot:TRINITY_DN24783_c0_g1_i1.p1 TRINITY_DN24783_c0_g1~~TRINITY_DN24783_c0_g1_i1.p1  ORF type:complete len:757 (-),score=152.51 TRINITY_DN24783_c0_g1_i1:32-2302(-)
MEAQTGGFGASEWRKMPRRRQVGILAPAFRMILVLALQRQLARAAAADIPEAANALAPREPSGIVCYEDQKLRSGRCTVLRFPSSAAAPAAQLRGSGGEAGTAGKSAEESMVELPGDAPWREPAIAALTATKALLCYLHANRNGTASDSRCTLIGVGNETGELAREGNETTVVADDERTAPAHQALAVLSPELAVVCRSSDVSLECQALDVINVTQPSSTLRPGPVLVVSAASVRRVAVAALTETREVAVCFEDLSHPLKPLVAVPRCVMLAVDGSSAAGTALRLGASAPLRFQPPESSGFASQDLDPDIQGSKTAAVSVHYGLTLASLGRGKLIFCYAVQATCKRCSGHACEVLQARNGELSLCSVRQSISWLTSGTQHLMALSLDALRVVFCYNAFMEGVLETRCELLKTLGEGDFIQFDSRDSVVVGAGAVTSLQLAPLKHGSFGASDQNGEVPADSNEIVVCRKPAGTFRPARCSILLFSRGNVGGAIRETLRVGLEEEATAHGRVSGLVFAPAVVPLPGAAALLRRSRDLDDQKTSLGGAVVASAAVFVLFVLVMSLAAFRFLCRSCWLLAYFTGLNPPATPEVEVVAEYVVKDLSPRVLEAANEAISPRLHKMSAALGDVSPRLMEGLRRVPMWSPRRRNRMLWLELEQTNLIDRLGLSPRQPPPMEDCNVSPRNTRPSRLPCIGGDGPALPPRIDEATPSTRLGCDEDTLASEYSEHESDYSHEHSEYSDEDDQSRSGSEHERPRGASY